MKRKVLTAILIMVVIIVSGPFVLFALAGFFSSAKFQWTTRKWESQIKREEDPEKLRSWAKGLLERYKNNAFDSSSIQTNFPPITTGINHEFTSIYYADAETNGQTKLDPTQDYVNVECDFGAWTGAWGLKIGETNFVSANPKASQWKPGIYFYRYSGD